uniref:Uncharacterized protein n=1 Tax=Mucochytrium quahogii TaxID=96639 RepID=A0A7S2RXB5_9STRA|mmetsp:Transcript_21514/g.47000  ORF Transcript_21514/g.47000 Transcript_21514/m.47000 type:complete len:578 (+) Transcript_21514:180-1913(+)
MESGRYGDQMGMRLELERGRRLREHHKEDKLKKKKKKKKKDEPRRKRSQSRRRHEDYLYESHASRKEFEREMGREERGRGRSFYVHYASPGATEEGHEGGKDYLELEEMIKSVDRLREQRVLVERIKSDTHKKDQRIRDLESTVHQLQTRISEMSLESLERERDLRSKLVEAERLAHNHKDTEDVMTGELKRLLNDAQKTENDLRCTLSRLQAEYEEYRASSEIEVKDLLEEVKTLKLENHDQENEVAGLRQALHEKSTQLERMEGRKMDLTNGVSRRCRELEQTLSDYKLENMQLVERVRSVTQTSKKQSEILEAKEHSLEEAEKRENLLQSTIRELEQNLDVIRAQVDVSDYGDRDLRKQLEQKSRALEEKEVECEEMRTKLLQAEFDSKYNGEQQVKEREKLSSYEQNLQRASVHRQRMELQLQNLASKVQDLQSQLVQEMAANAALSKQLDEERLSRTKVSKQRLHILSQFYKEENRLKETLDYPFATTSQMPPSKLGKGGFTDSLDISAIQDSCSETSSACSSTTSTEDLSSYLKPSPPRVALKTTASSRAKTISKSGGQISTKHSQRKKKR